MATAKLRTIFNSSDGPLFVDRQGRTVGPGEFRDGVDVTLAPMKGYVSDGRFVVKDEPAPAPADSTSTTPQEA